MFIVLSKKTTLSIKKYDVSRDVFVTVFSFISVLSPKYIPRDLTDDKSIVFQVLVASVFIQSNVGAESKASMLKVQFIKCVIVLCASKCNQKLDVLGDMICLPAMTVYKNLYIHCVKRNETALRTLPTRVTSVSAVRPNTLYQIPSRSQFFHSLNPMHVYRSRQPRAFRCVTSLLHMFNNLVGLLYILICTSLMELIEFVLFRQLMMQFLKNITLFKLRLRLQI